MPRTLPRIESSIVLENISWKTYERLLKEMGERPLRLTYDNGDLEIMTISHGHEHSKSIIGSLIVMLAFELNIAIHPGGANTMRSRLKKKGMEPDECYWIANEKAMRGREAFDPEQDPPPDLAVEVDVTSSFMDRMSIYAALGIPEVWRYRRRRLRAFRLNDEAIYDEAEHSLSFPQLRVSDLEAFIHQSKKQDLTTVLRSFVKWVRKELVK